MADHQNRLGKNGQLLEQLPDGQRSLKLFFSPGVAKKHLHDKTERAATTIVRTMPITTTMTTVLMNR